MQQKTEKGRSIFNNDMTASRLDDDGNDDDETLICIAHRHRISNALCILMLREKVCLQRLFERAFCTALISELVWKRIPESRTGDRGWPTAKCCGRVVVHPDSDVELSVAAADWLCWRRGCSCQQGSGRSLWKICSLRFPNRSVLNRRQTLRKIILILLLKCYYVLNWTCFFVPVHITAANSW